MSGGTGSSCCGHRRADGLFPRIARRRKGYPRKKPQTVDDRRDALKKRGRETRSRTTMTCPTRSKRSG